MNTDSGPITIFRADYSEPDFSMERVDLTFDIGAEMTRVHSSLQVKRRGGDKPLVLNGEQVSLVSVHLDGQPLSSSDYKVDGHHLTIASVPESFTLSTVVDIHPNTNTALEGLFTSADFLLTQCEAEGFRKITYFLDRPDVMSTYRVRLNADRTKYPVLLSNGNLCESGAMDDGRHYAIWEDPFPKPSYLFALVAGDLAHVEDTFTTKDGREVALKIYVEKENLDKVDHAMLSLKNSMAWDESRFNLIYDLDVFNIVATNDFNMGAMENKSLNIFNAKYVLAKPETATDSDFLGIEAVVGHEYFHNWTGNRVTCRDWFQLSLKEGLTVFRDQEFSADMQSRAVKRIADVRTLRTHQFAEDAGPMAHPIRPDSFVEINNFYTLTVYEKGAEVIRMIHTLLGEEAFQKGMKCYFDRYDGQAVTCDAFREAMADASGVDLTQFEGWYSQAGTPVVKVHGAYDAANKTYSLKFAQSTPATPGQADKHPQHMPVRLGLVDRDGNDFPLKLVGGDIRGDIVELRKAEEEFVFANIPHEPVPSLFRGFSAPVKVAYDYEMSQLASLMANDSDSFNRWDASQTLTIRVLLSLVADADKPVPDFYLDAVGSVIRDQNTDPGLIAESLGMPSENYLAAVMADSGLCSDVEGIHRARSVCRAAIAERHRDALQQRYKELCTDGAYELTPQAMAARSLKNVCMAYLCAVQDFAPAVEQFASATNMTDSIGALAALVHNNAPSAGAALQTFLDRWRESPLVCDKWLVVQATNSQPGSFARIDALLEHPVFNIKNPNKVRSLIGAFGQGNPLLFHAADGSGYRWLADRVAQVDAINPQVASRLVRAFDPWKRYDTNRQELARAQLLRLQALELSENTGEIVGKSLGVGA